MSCPSPVGMLLHPLEAGPAYHTLLIIPLSYPARARASKVSPSNCTPLRRLALLLHNRRSPCTRSAAACPPPLALMQCLTLLACASQIWTIDGQPRQLDKIVGRRKKKRSYEYEVAWVGLTSLSFNRWITREVRAVWEQPCDCHFVKVVQSDVKGASLCRGGWVKKKGGIVGVRWGGSFCWKGGGSNQD